MNRATATDAAQAPRETRRTQILQAARRRFAQVGFRDASMASIATAAGMSVGHVYHYFDSKDAIIAEVVRSDLNDRPRTLASMRGPEELAKAMLPSAEEAEDVASGAGRLGSWLQAGILVEAGRNGEVARLIAEADDECRRHLLRLMPWPRHAGGKADAGQTAAIELVLTLWDGLRVRNTADQATALLARCLETVLTRLAETAMR